MTDLRQHIIEPKMYSLKHWLKERDLSRSTFYELQKDGLAPKITKIGKVNKNFITKADSDLWDTLHLTDKSIEIDKDNGKKRLVS